MSNGHAREVALAYLRGIEFAVDAARSLRVVFRQSTDLFDDNDKARIMLDGGAEALDHLVTVLGSAVESARAELGL